MKPVTCSKLFAISDLAQHTGEAKESKSPIHPHERSRWNPMLDVAALFGIAFDRHIES
jgi:hypothetical protein